MSPSELDGMARELFGERWQRPLSEALGMSPGSVSNWLREDGRVPVPGPVRAALQAWVDLLRATGLRPPVVPGATTRFDPAARPGVRGRKPRYARLIQQEDMERAPRRETEAPFPCPGRVEAD